MNILEKYTIHDIEVFPNLFLILFKNHNTGRKKLFVIFNGEGKRVNQYRKLCRFLKEIHDSGHWLVGFNNLNYDAQIVEFLISNYKRLKDFGEKTLTEAIYNLSQEIINISPEERFETLVPEWRLTIPNIDLMRQCHYDGKGKRTSLKWLEYTMRLTNIQSLPLPFNEPVSDENFDKIVYYVHNDVDATDDFFEIKKFETDLRLKLSQKYDLNLINASEPKLAREIFGKYLSEGMGIEYRELKERRTYRSKLKGIDLLFNYVKFEDPILKAVHDFFLNIEFNPYDFSENNLGTKGVEKVFRFANIPDVVVGLGGIHGCIASGVYKAEGTRVIRDIDVKSYYPNLGIENDLYPEHLSKTFCKIYKDIYEMRVNTPKSDPVNYILKIVLNSTYGLSKEPNNYLHDPKYTFSITINGQLLLLMLAEMLKKKVKDIVFYQLNTDGVTIGYDEKFTPIVDKVLKAWEKLTRLELEDNYYKKMVIKDVNNYLALDKKDKVKRKGLFAYSMKPEDRELDYHKNPSGLVIPMALEQFFLYGKNAKEFLLNHNNIFDFCYGVKVKRDFDLYRYFLTDDREVESEVVEQKVCRYFISKENSSLKKKYNNKSKMPGRTIELHKGFNTTLYNVHIEKPMPEYNIDYLFYLKEINKVIDEIQPNASNLKLFND